MKDILIEKDEVSGSKEREPILIEKAQWCEWHRALTISWDCYCNERIDVEVRVYKR